MKTLWMIAVMALVPFAAQAQMMSVGVKGMTCDACATTVKASLESLPEVKEASIDVAEEKASLVLKDVNAAPSPEALEAAIDKAGYTLGDITR